MTDEEKTLLALKYNPEVRLCENLCEYLTAEDKKAAEKAAKLLIRDYGEVLKKLEEE